MRQELINEAFSLGVDCDRIQGWIAREDEDGLSGCIAERKRKKREEAAAQVEAVPETEDAARTAYAQLQKDMDAQTALLAESSAALKAAIGG